MATWRRFLVLLLALLALCSTTLVNADDAAVSKSDTRDMRAKTNHILVDTEAEADAIVEELSSVGNRKLMTIAKLAKEKSKCSQSAERGGYLGWITRGEMAPEVDRVVFDNEPGKVYKVRSEFGWHVVYTIRLGHPDDENPDDGSWGYSLKVWLVRASPFLSPVILVVIFFCGQRSSTKIAGPKARASHILVKTEAEVDALLQEINSAADKKKKLAELAASKSTCPSGRKGGDLGLFGKGQMVPPFEKVAFEEEVGSVHKVQTQFGWHIVMVTDRLVAAGDKKDK